MTLKRKAVIFDMDGVITNTMDYHVRANIEAVKNVTGVKITRRDVLLREGRPGAKFFREVLHQHGHKASAADIKEISEVKKRIFHKILRKKFVTGSRPFLRHLLAKGFALGLVTGSTRQELGNILPKYLRDEFSAIVTGDDVSHGKPHGEPYRKALKKLGVNAAEAFVLENAPLGIQSAKRAGITVGALTTTLKPRDLARADYVFASYQALRKSLTFERMK